MLKRSYLVFAMVTVLVTGCNNDKMTEDELEYHNDMQEVHQTNKQVENGKPNKKPQPKADVEQDENTDTSTNTDTGTNSDTGKNSDTSTNSDNSESSNSEVEKCHRIMDGDMQCQD